jgi:hypothetical protein
MALLNAVEQHSAVDLNRIIAKSPESYRVNQSRGLVQLLNCVGATVAQVEVDQALLSQLR